MLGISGMKGAFRRHLPSRVWEALRFAKGLPRKVHEGPLAAQIYVNDNETRCYLGIHNFYSVLAPQIYTDARVEIAFLDPNGKELFRIRQELAHFAAQFLDIQQAFRERGITSPYGIVSVSILPRHARRPAYKTLGMVRAHFYMFYLSSQGSLGDLHPTSVVEPVGEPTGNWESKQVFVTNGLSEIVLFQCNPSPRPHSMEFRLIDATTGTVAVSKRLELPPMSTRLARVPIGAEPALPKELTLAVDALPTGNSKPMLQRRFRSGLYSLNHM